VVITYRKNGSARLVDHQVGVAGVARVGRGALRGQLGVQRLPETPRMLTETSPVQDKLAGIFSLARYAPRR
jgi:hypothetical protein